MSVLVMWGVRNILGASQEALVISFYFFPRVPTVL